MKKNKNIVLLIISVLTILLSITSCKEKELEFPLGGPIPQSEIVFMPDADPVSANHDTKSLGFITPAGGNQQEYTFTLITGYVSTFGTPHTTQYASHPQWSISGDSLGLSVSPVGRLIDSEGKMYGQACVDIIGSIITFDLQGNVFSEISKHAPVFNDYKDITSTTLIARYDLKSCQIVSVFSLPLPFNSLVDEINESSNGLLTAAFWDSDEDIEKILIYDQTKGESQTLPGYHPSLTEDGALLAYYNSIGALVVRDMETEEEWELFSVIPTPQESYAAYVSMPGWSPNNKWLVYNTPEGEIFKINIETKENIYLTYGWAPDWR